MKSVKLFLIILTFLIVLNSVNAKRYVNYEFKEGIISDGQLAVTNNSVNNVDVIGFVCAGSSCNTVSSSLWNGSVLNSGNNSNIILIYPTNLQSSYGYGIYYFKDGFIPWESNPNWWGTNPSDPQGPFEVVLSKKDVCSAPIDSFNMLNEVQQNIPLVMSIDAGLDAATYAAIQSGGSLAYIPPTIEQYYSVETNISLRIYDSSNNLIEEQTKTVSIPYSGVMGVEFNWTPTIPGDYRAVVSTYVIDAKCLSSQERSTSKEFHVLSEDPKNMCYSLLNGVYVSDQFPIVNETITISGNKISNYADNNYSLTAVPTNISLEVVDQNESVVDSTYRILPANTNAFDPIPFDFTYLADRVGIYGLIVSAVANSSLCNNLTNLPEVVRLDITVQPRNYSGNQPPVLAGILDLEINESDAPPANWIDLWNYANDAEDTDSQLQFRVVSQTNPSLINCRISNNRYINCDLTPERYGFSDIIVEAKDSDDAFDRDSFRITVNEVITRPLITNIPDVNFDEDSSATLNLNLYVTDPDNNVSELLWTVSGNNHIYITINSNNIATFTADRNWYGTENILFTVSDPEGYNDSETVRVTVNALEDSPVINIWYLSFSEDGYLILNLSDYVTDPDNDVSELNWAVTGGNHIHIAIDNNNIATFTVDPNWYGIETFVFAVRDSDGFSDSANVVVEVVNVNDEPVINPIGDFNLRVKEEIKINLNNYVSDIDNGINELTWSYRASKNLEVSVDKNNIATIKAKTKLGAFSVTFTVTDPDGLVASVTLKVSVSYIQKNSDLMFDTVRVVNEFLRPGDDLMIDVGLRNSGYLDFDELKISAVVYELGIGYSLTSFDLDEQDTIHDKISVRIPEYSPRGIYDIRIVVSNDDVRRVVNREFVVI